MLTTFIQFSCARCFSYWCIRRDIIFYPLKFLYMYVLSCHFILTSVLSGFSLTVINTWEKSIYEERLWLRFGMYHYDRLALLPFGPVIDKAGITWEHAAEKAWPPLWLGAQYHLQKRTPSDPTCPGCPLSEVSTTSQENQASDGAFHVWTRQDIPHSTSSTTIYLKTLKPKPFTNVCVGTCRWGPESSVADPAHAPVFST